MTLDYPKFAKVLALAESSNDAEALAAVRKAASMARAAGMSLGQAVGRQSTTSGFSPLGTHKPSYEMGKMVGRQEGFESAVRFVSHEVKRMERLKAQVAELEAELAAIEDRRPPLDWVDLAERHFAANRRGHAKEIAKGLLYRATTGQLTDRDKAFLRRFAPATPQPKTSRKKKASIA